MKLRFLIPLAKLLRARVTRRPPDVRIGSETPYMDRWWVIPRNRWFNVYLHHFRRRDEDRALHDHPWWSISFIFDGTYFEHTEVPSIMRGPHGQRTYTPKVTQRDAGAVAWRGAESRHRISLPIVADGDGSYEVPCWTIFITGPKVRDWGFWCKKPDDNGPGRFVDWRIFTGSDHNVTGVGSIGAGCGEDM